MDTVSFFGKEKECNKLYDIYTKYTPYGTLNISAEFYYKNQMEAATVYFKFRPYGLNYDCTCNLYRSINGKNSGNYVATFTDYDTKNKSLKLHYYSGKEQKIMLTKKDINRYNGASLFEYSMVQITDEFMRATHYALRDICSHPYRPDLIDAATYNNKPMKGKSTHYSLYDGTVEFYIARNCYVENDIFVTAKLSNNKTCCAKIMIYNQEGKYSYEIMDYPPSTARKLDRKAKFPENVTTEEDALICAYYSIGFIF